LGYDEIKVRFRTEAPFSLLKDIDFIY
jgi:hypothetical protein